MFQYNSVIWFAVLNQHSLGTEFSWKFLQNTTHWRGYFHQGWVSKWNKKGSERFIGFFQCWKELCWWVRGGLCRLASVGWACREWTSVSSFCLKWTLGSLVLYSATHSTGPPSPLHFSPFKTFSYLPFHLFFKQWLGMQVRYEQPYSKDKENKVERD